MKRFYRVKQGAVIAGVCTGLAEYTNIDVAIIRVITVILLIGSGLFPFGLAYLLVALFVPYKDEKDRDVVSEQ